MIKEALKDFLAVKQAEKEGSLIKEYSLQITSGEPYLFQLAKGVKGGERIKCSVTLSEIDPIANIKWYKLIIGESTYHISENSLTPPKIIMLINDYLRIYKALLGEGAGGETKTGS